ncbi:MAG: hypothetical protein M0Z50_10020 [Planctomycetia bacterium]|nr:hypothetical protein [Planctomycetia bacterium]
MRKLFAASNAVIETVFRRTEVIPHAGYSGLGRSGLANRARRSSKRRLLLTVDEAVRHN